MSVWKSKEKIIITYFFELIFLKMGTSPKSSIFATVGSRTSTNNGVVQRGNTTGTTIGKHNGGNKTGNSRKRFIKLL